MTTFYRTVIYCSFTIVTSAGIGQQQFGSWNIISLKVNLDKNWSIFQETQLRSQDFYKDFSYFELKGGINYAFHKIITTLAFGRFVTCTDGGTFKKPYLNGEWRLWEQLLTNSYFGRLKIENRARIQQRWSTALGYRNRLEYRLNLVAPVNRKTIQAGTVYLTSWDDIYFTDKQPHLETNRVYAGAGCQLTKQVTVQTGFLSVVNYKPDDTRAGSKYLQVSVFVETNARNRHHEKTRSNVE